MSPHSRSPAEHRRIIAGETEHSAWAVRYHREGQCKCLSLNGPSSHDCTQHGHVLRRGPWGDVCRRCGAKPEWERGEGRWVTLGEHSRVWVPDARQR